MTIYKLLRTVLVAAIMIAGVTGCTFSSTLASLMQSNLLGVNTSLLPADHGLPDSIAGYNVLAVETSATTACTPPGMVHVILQSTVPDIQSFLASVNPKDVLQALQQIDPNTHWETEFVGSGISFEELATNNARWDAGIAVSGCVTLGGLPQMPTPSATP